MVVSARKIIIGLGALVASAALLIGIAPSASAATTTTVMAQVPVDKAKIVSTSMKAIHKGKVVATSKKNTIKLQPGTYRVSTTTKYQPSSTKTVTKSVKVDKRVKVKDGYYQHVTGGTLITASGARVTKDWFDRNGKVLACQRVGAVTMSPTDSLNPEVYSGRIEVNAVCTSNVGKNVMVRGWMTVANLDKASELQRAEDMLPLDRYVPVQSNYFEFWSGDAGDDYMHSLDYVYQVTSWDMWVPATYATEYTWVKKPVKVTTYGKIKTATRARDIVVKTPKPDTSPGYPAEPSMPVTVGGGYGSYGGDVDCAGGGGNGPYYQYGRIWVGDSDPYGLDLDGDGWGCE